MQTGRWLLKILLGCWALTASGLGLADQAIQAPATIQSAAQAFLLAQHRNRPEPPQIQWRELDPRLRLAKCAAALETFLPAGAKTVGATSIGVRCPGPAAWTVYQSASVRVFDQVLVASRFLPKGTILSAADLRAERRDLSALSGGYETTPATLIGKQLRQALMAGAEIPPLAVKTLPVVRRGEMVTLVSRRGGMEVSSSGVALSDAELGGRVRIRNESSQRVVEGTVIDRNQVEIGR